MANFGAMVLTSQGLQLQAQAQTGGTLTFTSVIAGDGYLADGQDPVTLTELISPVSTAILNITSNEIVGDGTTNLKARIQSGSKAFYLREIGVMAKINNGTPILYAYANAGAYADFIPSIGSNTEVVQDLNLITIIGNTENVTANITLDVIPDGSITTEKLGETLKEVIEKAENIQNYSAAPTVVGKWIDGRFIYRIYVDIPITVTETDIFNLITITGYSDILDFLASNYSGIVGSDETMVRVVNENLYATGDSEDFLGEAGRRVLRMGTNLYVFYNDDTRLWGHIDVLSL